MLFPQTIRVVRVTILAAVLSGALAVSAVAAPSSAETAADRERLESALSEWRSAQAAADAADERSASVLAELDRLVAEENSTRERLGVRVERMYRADDLSAVGMLFGASTLQDFIARWDLLARLARKDADTIEALEIAAAETERSAKELLTAQSERARTLDALAQKVDRARQELAASEAALREYEAARTAARQAQSAPQPPASDSRQQLTGSGDWQSAVASHYGRTFTGRGASGAEIGPYSMIVAHKTLAFGTLIEFEYDGKRAVAEVADRGPHVAGREFDLGPGVVRVLDFSGVHEVRYRIISR